MSLVELIAELRDDCEELYSILRDGHPIASLAKEYEQLEERLVAFACCSLLVNGDTQRFRHLLLQAAFCHRSFLSRSAVAGHVDPVYHARSRSKAVFAALAAADAPLALAIAERSSSQFLSEGEYADDFAYHRAVHALLAAPAGASVPQALAAYEAALGDGSKERLAVCEAMARADEPAFAAAFGDLLRSEATRIEAEAAQHLDDPAFEPQARISVEGLGLLHLASRFDIHLPGPEAAPLCPALAICSPGSAQPEDVFAQLAGR